MQSHSGNSATIRESNHGSGVCKKHYALYYVPKSSILLAGTGIWKISSVACRFSSIKIGYSDYLKSLISRINEVHVFSIKYHYSDILLKKHKLHFSRFFCCNYTCYCVNMVSVVSASRYHLRYQKRSSIHICGLIPRNFGEFAEAVPIECSPCVTLCLGLIGMNRVISES